MRKLIAILSLVSMSLTAIASESPFLGTYGSPSGIRFFGYTKDDCAAENVRFEENENACYKSAESTISIEENQQNKKIVKISVIFGPANMRDLSGVVTQVNRNILTVKEADIDDSGSVGKLVKGGCVLNIKIANNIAILNLGKNCDADLGRASGAIKK